MIALTVRVKVKGDSLARILAASPDSIPVHATGTDITLPLYFVDLCSI